MLMTGIIYKHTANDESQKHSQSAVENKTAGISIAWRLVCHAVVGDPCPQVAVMHDSGALLREGLHAVPVLKSVLAARDVASKSMKGVYPRNTRPSFSLPRAPAHRDQIVGNVRAA
jgi:hypothetical protein